MQIEAHVTGLLKSDSDNLKDKSSILLRKKCVKLFKNLNRHLEESFNYLSKKIENKLPKDIFTPNRYPMFRLDKAKTFSDLQSLE